MTANKTILIVDDAPVIRTVLSKYIKALPDENFTVGISGSQILEAANATEALECLRTFKVDLIFLDLLTPERDGLRFLSIRRDNPLLSSVPVIVCSYPSNQIMVDEALSLGADGYAQKPFTLKCLEEQLRQVLTKVDRTKRELGCFQE